MSEDQKTAPMGLEEKSMFLVNKFRQIVEEVKDRRMVPEGEDREPTGMEKIKGLTLRMHEISLIHSIIEPLVKDLDSLYDQLRKKEIPDLMQAEDVRTVTFDGIGRVQLAGDCYASIPADQKEAAFAWLREHNYGDLIQEQVNSSTLKAWAKEGLETGRELPEGVFRVEPYTRASIVKVRGGKKKVSE
ncbi:hypothetical protein [Burkholderia phage BCSR129]|nr:hypothetical protein [Burkholderia phage BCSR129]